jgi:hypothetical protein
MKRNFAALLLLSLVLMAGCKTVMVASSIASFDPLSYFKDPVNMMEKNYATADYLADRGRGFVKPHHKIKALPLQDFQEPRIVTHFGKQTTKQVGERFIQLGYNVDLSEVWTEVNKAYAPAPQPVTNDPDFILAGSYVRKTSSLDVTVRIQDARTGVERAVFSYSVPRRGDIRKGSEPKPVIYRTTPANN